MSTNYHDPILAGEAGTPATLNTRFADLDQQITSSVAALQAAEVAVGNAGSLDVMLPENVLYGAVGDGTTDDYAAFADLVAALPVDGGVAWLTGLYLIGTDITLPANVTLRFAHGARLVVATGKTVTINGLIEAGLQHIFTLQGTGKVLFGPANPRLLVEWWGAVGDFDGTTGTDNQAAIDAALAAANLSLVAIGGSSGDRRRKPTVVFSARNGYCTATTTGHVAGACVPVWMDGPLVQTSVSDIVLLTCGETGGGFEDTLYCHYKVWVSRKTASDWSDWDAGTKRGTRVGVRFYNVYWSRIAVTLAHGFTTGVQAIGEAGRGFNYNEIELGIIRDNKIAVQLVAGSASGWCNDNTWYGGSLRNTSGDKPTLTRYGIHFASSGTYCSNNLFVRPSFELNNSALGIPVYLEHGERNEIYGAHIESSSAITMLCENNSDHNVFYTDKAFGELRDDTARATNRFHSRYQWWTEAARVGWNSGPLHKRWVYADSASSPAVNFAGVHVGRTNTATLYYAISGYNMTDDYVELGSTSVIGVFVDTQANKRFAIAMDCAQGLPLTVLAANATSGATTITVASATGFEVGGPIEVRQDNYTSLATTVVSVNPGTGVIELTAGLTNAASAGCWVGRADYTRVPRLAFRVYDAAGAVITGETGSDGGALLKGWGTFYSAAYLGGHCWLASSTTDPNPALVKVHAEVKRLEVLLTPIGVPATLMPRVRSFGIMPLDGKYRNLSVFPSYEQVIPGTNLGSVLPTKGYYPVGKTVLNYAPAASAAWGWSCINAVATTMRVQAVATDTTLEVTGTTGMLAADKIGVAVDVIATTMRVQANATDTTLEVTSTSGMAAGNRFGVVLDDGTTHWTTISSVTDGDTLVIAAGIPAGRNAPLGANVYLGDRIIHWTAISTVTDGDTLVVSAGIPASRTAEVGAVVYTNRWRAIATLGA